MPQDSQYILGTINPFDEGANTTLLKDAYPKSPIYSTGDIYEGDDENVKTLFQELVQEGTVGSTIPEGATANVPTANSTHDRDYTGNTDWVGLAPFPAMPLTDDELSAANLGSSYMPNINSPTDANPDNQPATMTDDQKAELPTAANSSQYGSDSQKGTLSPATATESINDQTRSTLASLMGSAGSYSGATSESA